MKKQVQTGYTKENEPTVDRFRIHFRFHFKAGLSVKSLLWISVSIHIASVTNYHDDNFALAFKKRLKGILKWSIELLLICLKGQPSTNKQYIPEPAERGKLLGSYRMSARKLQPQSNSHEPKTTWNISENNTVLRTLQRSLESFHKSDNIDRRGLG